VAEPGEITSPVRLTGADGRLAPAAVGWSRRPLHDCALPGPWGRRKRWDFWCVTDPRGALMVTYADLDYLGIAQAAVVDFASRQIVERIEVMPLAIGFRQPDQVGGADIAFRRRGLSLEMRDQGGATRLVVRGRSWRGRRFAADVTVELPSGHESLGVVIPWSDRRFQYTSKHVARPATGTIEVDGARRELAAGDAFGCLDFGRGVWPARTLWNWGAGAGRAGGRLIGLQLGGRWTDGTGMTENALLVDGRIDPVASELEWDYDRAAIDRPWRVRSPGSPRVDLTFTPMLTRRARIELGVAGSDLHHAFGHWHGSVEAFGERLAVSGLLGWAEEHRARW